MSDETIWGIHAGKTGDADTFFLKKNCVAIGWRPFGDLSAIRNNREAFKAKYAETYPSSKQGAVPTSAGQLYRFIHVMKEGDLVAYPSKRDRNIHIGRVVGPYQHVIDDESEYPNRRPVQWLKAVPRTRFSQGALYEIGSAMSLFQIKNYSDEYYDLLEGNAPIAPTKKDKTVALVVEEIEDTTRDFILKQLGTELKGHPFAGFVGHLLQAMGYRTRIAAEGPDGGVDIVAHKDELGFEPPLIKVQVKSNEGNIGEPVASQLYGKVDSGEYGLLITLGKFTAQAKTFAANKPNLRLIDGEDLVNLILTHYEQFDSRYKGILPLKKVYIPEQIAESDE